MYSLVPIIALLINIFVSVYIFAQKRNSRINNAYIYYSINLSLWIICEILTRQNIPKEYLIFVFKISSIFWMAMGFWFLNFSYKFVDKNKDLLYYVSLFALLASISVSLSTNHLIKGYIDFYWGPDEVIGIIYLPVFFITNFFPIIYGSYIINRFSNESKSELIKKSSPLIIWGTIVTIIVAFLSSILLPHFLGLRDTVQFAESITVVQSLFIFIAVYKYRLFGLGIKDLSYNLFNSMKDAVIVTDETMKILHFNKSAESIFGVSFDEVIYESIEVVLKEASKIEDNSRIEKYIKINDKYIIILITKNKIIQVEEHLGYMYYIKDISERKKIEKELREKESTFSALFESSPDVLIVVDIDGKIKKTNQMLVEAFGYYESELLDRKIDILIPQRFISTHDKHRKDYNENPRRRAMGAELELFGLKKDGSEFPVEVMLSPLTIDFQKITLVTVRDITARKLSENQLRESEEKYRSLVLNHPHGIIENLFDGTILFANKAYTNLYELNTDNIIGKKVWEIHEDEEFIQKTKEFLEISKNGEIFPETTIVKRKTRTGKFIELQLDWEYKLDSDGNKIGHLTVVTDITQKRKNERILQKQRMMLNQAEKLAKLGSWQWNKITDELTWSDELYRIYNKDKNNFIPTFEEYQNLVHPEDRKRVYNTIQNTIKTGLPFFHFERIIRTNGEIRILSTRGIAQKNDMNEVIGLYGSCLDVTQFKNIEDELKVSQKQLRALSANLQQTREEERTRIAREIHDELGQVLTAINMDVGLMIDELEDLENLTKENLVNKLHSIEVLIERLIKSVQDISTDLRPDVLEHLGLIPALEWQLEEFKKRFKIETVLEKRINQLDFDEDKRIGIFRIFQEALTNVARHSKADKVIVLLDNIDDHFHMKVKDNGVGISDDNLENIKSIGLFGIKERVLLLRGNIVIKRAKEGGTELILKVPINTNKNSY